MLWVRWLLTVVFGQSLNYSLHNISKVVLIMGECKTGKLEVLRVDTGMSGETVQFDMVDLPMFSLTEARSASTLYISFMPKDNISVSSALSSFGLYLPFVLAVHPFALVLCGTLVAAQSQVGSLKSLRVMLPSGVELELTSCFSPSPTEAPTMTPTVTPTVTPTSQPTVAPTLTPTVAPTAPTLAPTVGPTAAPTTFSPTTLAPTRVSTCYVLSTGISWCVNALPCVPEGNGCESICESYGKHVVINDAQWFQAQNTLAKCQEIASYLCPGCHASIAWWMGPCAVSIGTEVYCSYNPNCASNQRWVGYAEECQICPCS